MATFILTVIGDDRPGLVSALSAPISAHGASWERSQMSRLAGKFAGIVLVAVADEGFDALATDLAALKDQGLQVVLERTDEASSSAPVDAAEASSCSAPTAPASWPRSPLPSPTGTSASTS